MLPPETYAADELLPPADAPLTLAEESLSRLFRAFFMLLAVAGGWFALWLLSPRAGAAIGNLWILRLGLKGLPPDQARLFVVMGLSLIAVLMLMAWRVWHLPRLNRALVPIFYFAKAVSVAGALLALVFDALRGMYVVTVFADGLMAWLAYAAYQRAADPQQVPAWPRDRAEAENALPPGPPDFETVATASDHQRELWMRISDPPAIDGLVGWQFKGLNTLGLTKLLRIRKFVKGMSRGSGLDSQPPIYGYNVAVEQDGREHSSDAWRCKPDDAHPRRFGFYEVAPVRAGGPDAAYPRALLLDYGAGHNPGFAVERLLRDYLVQPDPRNPDLILGKAYLALGPLRVPVSFFVLQRWRQVEARREQAAAPGAAGQSTAPPPPQV